MVRMSDILRRMGGEDEEEPPRKVLPSLEEEKKKEPPVQFREEVLPTTQLGEESPEILYQRFLDFAINEIFEKAQREKFVIEGKKIRETVEPVVDRILRGDGALRYFATIRSTPDYYLHAHAVNTCIFAIALGASLGYDRENLITLAMGALLHDLGMIKVMDVAQRKERLSEDQKKAIQKHVQFNVDLLKNVRDLPEKCLSIAKNVHERHDGRGYPIGLSGEELSEEAQIVSLCDIYEALTHPRSYRDRLSPYESLKEILKGKDLFNPSLLKFFIQQLTIYPIGCWVELSTGEQGQVVQTVPAVPLRPTLKIFFDSQKRRLAVPKLIDLAKHTTLFVKRSLEEKEIRGREGSVS